MKFFINIGCLDTYTRHFLHYFFLILKYLTTDVTVPSDNRNNYAFLALVNSQDPGEIF